MVNARPYELEVTPVPLILGSWKHIMQWDQQLRNFSCVHLMQKVQKHDGYIKSVYLGFQYYYYYYYYYYY